MHPWLVYNEWLHLPTYFTLLMVGFTLASGLLVRESRREGLRPRLAIDAALWAIPASLIGSRAAHVLLEAPAFYWTDPMAAVAPNGGWVLYGGLAGATISVGLYCRIRGLSFWRIADVMAPALPFGLIFGRLGCLGGACCRGRPADWPFGWEVPWSVTYFRRRQLPDEVLGVPLHPAPLYAALFALTLFLVISWIRSRQRFPGEAVLALFGLYGAGRIGLEAFRADIERGLYFGDVVSTSQILGGATALTALMIWVIRSRAWHRSSSSSGDSSSTPTHSSGPWDS